MPHVRGRNRFADLPEAVYNAVKVVDRKKLTGGKNGGKVPITKTQA
jgi:hypothetical protein